MSDYDDALKRFMTAQSDDAAEMAWFCANALQILVGAVSPKLVWDGARIKGLSTKDLMKLAASDPMAVAELQWL